MALRAERRAREAGLKLKEAKDILAEFANLFAGIAARFQPQTTADGELVWRRPEHKSLFMDFGHRACIYAHWAAPFQSPTFKAIHFMNQWHEGPATQSTIEAAAALVTEDMDEETAARQYLIQVRGAA